MKLKLLILCTFIMNSALAFDLKQAAEQALFQADIEVGKENIEAYQVTKNGHEFEVEIKTALEILAYGCDFHGTQIACHEEGHDHKNLNKHIEQSTFDQMQEGADQAIVKFEKTLRQRGSSTNAISSYKVWTTPGTEDKSNDEHVDVWIRFDYSLNNQDKTVYVQCHEHDGAGSVCHYKQTATDEPQF